MRHIHNIENLPPYSHLVTIDVTGLYTHIPRGEVVQATREASSSTTSSSSSQAPCLHRFLPDINNIHENIKFTMTHTKPAGALGCECAEGNSIPFLDTSLEIKNGGKIVSDLYRKPSDRNKYLLPSSAHPHCVQLLGAGGPHHQ